VTDLALHLIDTGAGQPPRIDVRLDGGDLSTDDGLETAVLLSLITDRRAEADDVLPDGGTDRRGARAVRSPRLARAADPPRHR
jgi:phage gp46-like protein